ncbi:hypothetical protein B9J78_06295, partial [bacterium Unc6]|nr:hypothetical protein [bacterium Unc6]
NTKFFANYNNNFDADGGVGVLAAGGNLNKTTVNPMPPPRIGDLMPDGALIDTSGRSLTYRRVSNFPIGQLDRTTIEMWVKMNETPGGRTHYFFNLKNSGNTEYIWLRNNNGTLELTVRDNVYGEFSDTYGISTWQTGVWHHIAATITWDNNGILPGGFTELELFVDGITDGKRIGSSLFLLDLAMDDDMYVGTNAVSPGTNNANATIDSIRISNNIRYTANFTPLNRYQTSGTYTRSISLPTDVRWGTITWTAHTAGGSISMECPVGTPRGSDPSYLTGGLSPSINLLGTSIQYRATFSAPAGNRDTPVLDDVTIVYLPRAKIVYWKEESGLTL